MLKFIKHQIDARSLANKQKAAAAELQAIYDARAAMLEREEYLMRFSARLAVREIDMNIAARRTARQQVGA
jgi:hypothetical protein